MTREETKKLLMVMSSVYPNWKAQGGERFTIDVWQVFLNDYQFADIEKAFKVYVTTNTTGFAPDVGKLIQMVSELKSDQIKDWGKAWESVLDSVSKYGWYHTQEGLDCLDEITREAVKRIGYDRICMSDNLVSDRANFRTIYESLVESKKKENLLSPMALTDGEKKKLIG